MKEFYVIDDNPQIRKLISKILSSSIKECSVKEFTSLKDALEGLKNCEIHPDLIISDVMMPGENGLKLKRILKKESIDIPILFVTAMGGDEIFDNEYSIMSKPFSKQKLLSKISELMAA